MTTDVTGTASYAIDYTNPPEGPREPVFEDLGPGRRRAMLLDCPQFALELYEADTELELDTDDVAVAYCVLEGSGKLSGPVEEGETIGEDESGCMIDPGQTWLVPAALGRHRFQTGTGGLRLLKVSTRPCQ